MKTHRHLLVRLTAVALLISLFARPKSVWACSCAMPSHPAQAFADSQAVFVGTVTGISNLSQIPVFSQSVYTWAEWTNSPLPHTFYNQSVSFAVNQSWKGVNTGAVTITTASSGASCGYEFTSRQQYVVYAYDFSGNGLETNMCTRTTDISNAAADLTYLNTQPKLTLSPSLPPLWPILIGVALTIVLAAAVVWVVRRRLPAKKDML